MRPPCAWRVAIEHAPPVGAGPDPTGCFNVGSHSLRLRRRIATRGLCPLRGCGRHAGAHPCCDRFGSGSDRRGAEKLQKEGIPRVSCPCRAGNCLTSSRKITVYPLSSPPFARGWQSKRVRPRDGIAMSANGRSDRPRPFRCLRAGTDSDAGIRIHRRNVCQRARALLERSRA